MLGLFLILCLAVSPPKLPLCYYQLFINLLILLLWKCSSKHFTTELILEYTLQTGPTYGSKHEIHINGFNKAFKILSYSARFNSSCMCLHLKWFHGQPIKMASQQKVCYKTVSAHWAQVRGPCFDKVPSLDSLSFIHAIGDEQHTTRYSGLGEEWSSMYR